MSEDAATLMKQRLRADLRAAMKDKRSGEAKLIRALVAAIDNAEAPPAIAGTVAHDFRGGSAEVERLALGPSAVRDAILAEINERERAAAELERLGRTDRAEPLRAEARMAGRYLD